MEKGVKVYSRDGKHEGATTGGVRPCGMEGCKGQRVGVRWDDGKLTYPCTGGMGFTLDGSMRVLTIE